MSQEEEALSSAGILNVPNALSFLRLLSSVVFFLTAGVLKLYFGSAFLLAFGGVTDFLDGYIARHSRTVTELGKVLDPVADRALVIAVAVVVLWRGIVPYPLALPLVIREALMSLVTVVLAAFKARRIDVVFIGKAGTFALYVALPFFVISATVSGVEMGWRAIFRDIGTAIAIPGVVLLYVATCIYAPLAVKNLREALEIRRQR